MASESRRDLIVRMTADPAGFKKGMGEGAQATRAYYRELNRLKREQAEVDQVMEQAGQGMLVAGAALAAGLFMAGKAAVQWESDWAGVAKVVDGTDEQLAALEGDLRDLAKTLPASHTEIANVASAAAQLGVATGDITEFTQVAIEMGTATNLAAQDAAFAMARLMNIMQTAPDDVRRLGSAIVDLGNNSATTEQEIVDMALRIAGAGHTVGMSESEVLGFAAALSSVGIEAEAGGSAISRAFIKIEQAVADGGGALDQFAQIAGMTSSEFSTAFERDAAGAAAAFVEGLGRMQRSGEDVFGTLDELGLSEIRLRDALLRLAGAGDLLTDTLRVGNEAWDENTALAAEAERRYGTTAAQMQIARNRLNDFAIDMGEILLPIIAKAATFVGGLADAFAMMPGPLKDTITVLGLVAAGILLVGGAAVIAVPKMAAFNATLATMSGPAAKGAHKTLSGLASFMGGPWGLAIGGAITVAVAAFSMFAQSQAESKQRVDELSATLDEQTGAITDNTRAWVAHELESRGVLEAAQRLGLDLSTLTDAVLGNAAAADEVSTAYNAALAEISAFLEAHDATKLADVSDEFATEKDRIRNLIAAVEGLNGEVESLNGEFNSAVESSQRTSAAMGETSDTTEQLTAQQRVLSESLNVGAESATEAADAISNLDTEFQALMQSLFGVEIAEDAVAEQIQRVTDLAEENSATLDRNTEAGRENASAVRDLLGDMTDLIVAEAEAGASTEDLTALTDDLEGQFRDMMRAAGFSEDQIDDYAQAFDDIPALVETTLRTTHENIVINRIMNAPGGGPMRMYAQGGPVQAFPSGGQVRGPGTGTSDSIWARVSNGEYVVRANAVNRLGRDTMDMINTGRLPVGGGQSVTIRLLVDSAGGYMNDAVAESVRQSIRTNPSFRGDLTAAVTS